MLSDLLTHTVSIQRRSLTSDGMGGQNETWSTIPGKTAVKCRIWTPQRKFNKLDSGDAGVADRRMAIKKDQSLLLMDKVINGSEELFIGQRYSVRDSTKIHHYEYDLHLKPIEIGG